MKANDTDRTVRLVEAYQGLRRIERAMSRKGHPSKVEADRNVAQIIAAVARDHSRWFWQEVRSKR